MEQEARDVRLSFDAVAEVYDEIRPSYPTAVFDVLFDMLRHEPRIVEIGPRMAARLRSNLPSDRLRVTVADFEDVYIAPGSAEAIFSATAYHWIARPAQTDRPAEILQPGGVVAVVDLVQVDSADDAGFFAACQPIYERYGQRHTGPPAPARDAVDPDIRRVLDADDRFVNVSVRRYDWNQTYTAAEYRRLMRSYSGSQMMNDADRTGLLNDMEAFIRDHFRGQVTRPLVVTLTTAVRT